MPTEQQTSVDVSHPPFVVVSPTGDLDLGGAPGLSRVLSGLVRRGDRDVVVDLRGVGFLDSSGLAVLIRFRKMLDAQGGRFRVVAPQPIRRLFELTGMLEPLGAVETLEAALEE